MRSLLFLTFPPMSYQTVQLENSHYERAMELCRKNPPYAGSHRGPAAMQVGFLGEIIVRDYFDNAGLEYSPEFTTRHDLVVRNRWRTEIKTKDRTVAPEPHYECSVPLYNHEHQDVGCYFFVSLRRQKSKDTLDITRYQEAYIVGACNRTTLTQKGREWDANQTDPSNGTTFWTACRNIAINELLPPDQAISWFLKED